MRLKSRFLQLLVGSDAVLVSIVSTRGSVPREAGTWMAVFSNELVGTVGGGRLELDALAKAKDMAHRSAAGETVRYALGPSLGQCCGGEVVLRFEPVTARDIEALDVRLSQPLTPLALFGGGHVGTALVQVLGNLPFAVRWIDSRDEIFPDNVPDNVHCEHSDPVQAAVRDLPAGTIVLIMSFSHAEDLDVVAACLERQRATGDVPYIGLIGSKTKWASFRHRLEARGFTAAELASVTCPIGIPGISGKSPEVIAVGVAAQILQVPQVPTIPQTVYTLAQRMEITPHGKLPS